MKNSVWKTGSYRTPSITEISYFSIFVGQLICTKPEKLGNYVESFGKFEENLGQQKCLDLSTKKKISSI